MLAILNRVEAHVKLCQKEQAFNVTKLKNFAHFIQREVKEAKAVDVLKSSEEYDLVAAEIKGSEFWELAKSSDFGQSVVGDVELFEMHVVDVLNLGDVVAVQ